MTTLKRVRAALGRACAFRKRGATALLAVLLGHGLAANGVAPGNQSPKQQGITIASWWYQGFAGPESLRALDGLAATGATWVAIVVTQYQDHASSDSIQATSGTVTDEDLLRMIRHAHQLGLAVMLKPHIDLRQDRARSRSSIGEAFVRDAQWHSWFSAYTAFIDHYAQLAERAGVEQLAVGTELAGTSQRASDWRDVVSSVRGVFHGTVTYAALASEAETITWWDAVDLIGVDAYFVISTSADPSLGELELGWRRPVSQLAELSHRWAMPVLFTEVGYRSVRGAASRPWDWTQDGGTDLQVQARAYQATFQSVFHEPWFAGMYWWLWDADPATGGPRDSGFTPHCKPAERVLVEWYGGKATPSCP